MSLRHEIPRETKELQARASDPRHSAWVSANAGSGKTHVLAQRVIRLLLDDVDPARILCLTYTRAAAANMAGRVFSTLSKWTTLPDAELERAIAELEGAPPSRDRLALARKLFARALETPGGLKIQTIHAFCEAVLHQFPLEANIAAQFRMIDPLMEEALFAAARRELLAGYVGMHASKELRDAFATVLQRAGEFGLDKLLEEIVQNRDGLRAFLDEVAGDDPPYAALFEEFGFADGENAASIAASVWPLPGFSPSQFDELLAVCTQAGATRALNMLIPKASLAFAEADPEQRLEHLRDGFLNADREAYKPAWLFPKAVVARLPDLPDRYDAACTALIETSDRLALYRMLDYSRAALTVAEWLVGRYEQLKAGRGLLDFNDLITRTIRLLSRQDAGPWVLYKLDRGIDHILLDEAQDTSPDQWAVVRALAGEFFAGRGAREDVHRTIFAVGDEKQSIYSFQGAAPESFAASASEFAARIRGAEKRFERVELHMSFRSTEDVLAAVDRVFADPGASRGLSAEGTRVLHSAIRAGVPGYVELWPSIGAASVEEPDDWTLPVDHATAPEVRLAETIASTVDEWLRAGEVIEGTGKRVTPGDVLVLVRKRGSFVEALSKALKERRIRVAGADRLRLSAHIAVKDLIALGHVVLQPHDDLSLAALLKSPVFGFDEDALFALAAGRGTASLRDALRRDDNPRSREASVRLDAWATEAAFRRPFEFYGAILARDGVRARMVGRLGPEAGEILDEFLSFALAQEKVGAPDLTTFLATLESSSPEIKREMDQARDEVRIMTVHASKGLEAPIVFLVDGGSAPFSASHLPRLLPFTPRNIPGVSKGYLWRASADTASEASRRLEDDIRYKAEDEYRRLLYVGMTRAEDRLIVCGFHGKNQPKPETWHSLVARALRGAAECSERAMPGLEEPVLRFCIPGPRTSVPSAETVEAQPPAAPQFPEALRQHLRPVTDLPRPLAPSGAGALVVETSEAAVLPGGSPVLDPQAAPGFAVERGIVLHRLLQVLPQIEPGEREAAVARYVARAGAGWTESERQAVLDSVFTVLSTPDFAPLFAPGSRAEVAVMGTLEIRGVPRAISGKIDRLAVTAQRVMIVDYKTGRPAPLTADEVHPDHIAQLALYRALIQPLYPERIVAAALLFTEAPRLVAVPPDALDAALARLRGS
jgi:double-strand break repair helicase AddA, alphaproteobacterial type